jgi:hypothetical protein
MNTHVETHCMAVADFKAWARRYIDADRKRRPLPKSPGEGAHPWSTWTNKWPFDDPSDLLGCDPYRNQRYGMTPINGSSNAMSYTSGRQSFQPGQARRGSFDGFSRGGRGSGRGSGRGGSFFGGRSPQSGRGQGGW